MLEEKALNIKKIYVALLNEGLEVWRPVKALQLSDSKYKILKDNEYDKESEQWEFPPGSIVMCEKKKIKEGVIKAAVCKIS